MESAEGILRSHHQPISSRKPHLQTPGHRDLQHHHDLVVPAQYQEPPQATGHLASRARAPDHIGHLQNHPAQIAVVDLVRKVVLTTPREVVAMHTLQRLKL